MLQMIAVVFLEIWINSLEKYYICIVDISRQSINSFKNVICFFYIPYQLNAILSMVYKCETHIISTILKYAHEFL